ncbi:MAG: hypothetical protein DDT28_00515 [Dehalococcoidia bacterium]|nr:hypothetical protein [Chloroflexota bacterium]
MITGKEILKGLPELLREEPQLRWEIYEILSAEFSRKEDLREYMRRSDEKFERIFQELKALREDSNRRFEAMDRRFEAMDRKFEAMNQELRALREDSNRRFEAMNQELRALREDSNRRFDEIRQNFVDLKDWVGIVVGGFQRRAGRYLEDAIAGTLRIALERTDISADKIKLRQKISDDEGVIGPVGRKYEIDLYVTNSSAMIFEIKSYGDREAVERFSDKARLAEGKMNLREVERVFITLEKQPEVIDACNELGITLV